MEKVGGIRTLLRRLTGVNAGNDGIEAQRLTRILVMPGARMVATERGTWRFPHVAPNKTNTDTSSSFQDEVPAGTSKMRAIGMIHKNLKRQHPDHRVVVLVTGGNEPSGHSRSDEARNQLTTKYEIPHDAVVSLRGVGQTLGNAEAVVDYLRKNEKVLKHTASIEVVENEYKLLRTWLMFSAALLKLETGKDLVVSEQDKALVRQELFSGNLSGQETMDVHMAHTHTAMGILEPYFKGLKHKVVPIVVEEVISGENDSTSAAYRQEYVHRLRTHPSVIARLNQEKQGVMHFLDGTYKML